MAKKKTVNAPLFTVTEANRLLNAAHNAGEPDDVWGTFSSAGVSTHPDRNEPHFLVTKASETIIAYNCFSGITGHPFSNEHPGVFSKKPIEPRYRLYLTSGSDRLGPIGDAWTHVIGTHRPHLVQYEGADPAFGQQIGPNENSYKTTVLGEGLMCVSDPDTANKKVWVTRYLTDTDIYLMELDSALLLPCNANDVNGLNAWLTKWNPITCVYDLDTAKGLKKVFDPTCQNELTRFDRFWARRKPQVCGGVLVERYEIISSSSFKAQIKWVKTQANSICSAYPERPANTFPAICGTLEMVNTSCGLQTKTFVADSPQQDLIIHDHLDNYHPKLELLPVGYSRGRWYVLYDFMELVASATLAQELCPEDGILNNPDVVVTQAKIHPAGEPFDPPSVKNPHKHRGPDGSRILMTKKKFTVDDDGTGGTQDYSNPEPEQWEIFDIQMRRACHIIGLDDRPSCLVSAALQTATEWCKADEPVAACLVVSYTDCETTLPSCDTSWCFDPHDACMCMSGKCDDSMSDPGVYLIAGCIENLTTKSAITVGVYTIAGQDILVSHKMIPETGIYLLDGKDLGNAFEVDKGMYVLDCRDVTVKTTDMVIPGEYTIAGQEAILKITDVLATGEYILDCEDILVKLNMVVDTGEYIVDGIDIGSEGFSSPTAGIYTVTGQLPFGKYNTPVLTGEYVMDGPDIILKHKTFPVAGQYIIDGQIPAVKTSLAHITGEYLMGGKLVAHKFTMITETGMYGVDGQIQILKPIVAPATGTYTLDCMTAAFKFNTVIDTGMYVIQGYGYDVPCCVDCPALTGYTGNLICYITGTVGGEVVLTRDPAPEGPECDQWLAEAVDFTWYDDPICGANGNGFFQNMSLILDCEAGLLPRLTINGPTGLGCVVEDLGLPVENSSNDCDQPPNNFSVTFTVIIVDEGGNACSCEGVMTFFIEKI